MLCTAAIPPEYRSFPLLYPPLCLSLLSFFSPYFYLFLFFLTASGAVLLPLLICPSFFYYFPLLSQLRYFYSGCFTRSIRGHADGLMTSASYFWCFFLPGRINEWLVICKNKAIIQKEKEIKRKALSSFPIPLFVLTQSLFHIKPFISFR